MGFSVNLFSIERNLVFIEIFYHKVAVASIGRALSLALGTDKEAKTATITLILLQSSNIDQDRNGLGDSYNFIPFGVKSLPVGGFNEEAKATYEFYISNLSIAPNTVIKSARFNAIINTPKRSPVPDDFIPVGLFGYGGNGTSDASNFETGELLVYEELPVFSYKGDKNTISWDIAPFINELLSQSQSFAGLSITGYGEGFSVQEVFTNSPYPDHPYTN